MAKRRFLVEWHPEAEILAAAKDAGWKEGDDGLFDYAPPEYHGQDRVFPNFGLAVGFARKMANIDVFCAPRIDRQRYVSTTAGDGGDVGEWVSDAVWEAHAESDLNEASPHWRP